MQAKNLNGYYDFNPHSREGSDQTARKRKRYLILISIHTPAKGVTTYSAGVFAGYVISIHTPAKGVTKEMADGLSGVIFQSTLPRRE